jgi:uncharacterized protein YjiS (DUF1127 family)
MSCGSTTCNSTNVFDAASPALPDLGWSWKTSLAWLIEIAMWWERRYQYRQLLELDDRLLADIGVSRTAVEEMREASLYERAWLDSR